MSNLTKRPVYQKGTKRTPGISKAEREHPAFQYGRDAEYREWAEAQPSCMTGEFDWVDGKSCCVSAHVRRAKDAGASSKPFYSCVSLRDEEHRYQHQHGELACLEKYQPASWVRWKEAGMKHPEQAAKAWFDGQVMLSVQGWIEYRKRESGI